MMATPSETFATGFRCEASPDRPTAAPRPLAKAGLRWEASMDPFRNVFLFGGEKLIICCVLGVHIALLTESVSNEAGEPSDELPLHGRTSRSKTSSFNISTFRPRRQASPLWSQLSTDCFCGEECPAISSHELEEEPGEVERVLALESRECLPGNSASSGTDRGDLEEKKGTAWAELALGVVANIAIELSSEASGRQQ